MTDRSFAHVRAESRVGGWDAMIASVNDLIRRRPQVDQATPASAVQPYLRNKVDHGICTVPIYRIVADLPPDQVFDQLLPQHAVLPRFLPEAAIELVELYQVRENFYVRDGNRHLAAARGRSQLFLSARVSELVFNSMPNQLDIERFLLADERKAFVRHFNCHDYAPALHMSVSTIGSYTQLRQHIERAHVLLNRFGATEEQHGFTTWYERVFLPVARLIRRRQVLSFFPAYSEADLFLWAVNRHGLWTEEQTLHERLRLARRNIVALWIAAQRQILPQ